MRRPVGEGNQFACWEAWHTGARFNLRYYAQYYLILGSAVGLRLPFVDRDNIISSPLTTCQTKVNAYHGNTCTAKYDALA